MSLPQSIVILGGTGFVGCHVAARLVADGHRVKVLSRNRDLKREVSVLPGVDVVNCNVHDRVALARELAGADAAVNLVGILNEAGFSGKGFQRAHVDLTQHVVDACREQRVPRLLQMSALNAGRGDSHYLRTRGEAEAVVERSGLQWTIFRPSVIFGPEDGLFFRFATLLKLMPVLPLARAGTRFAPVYVGDVAAAFARAIADRGTIGRHYELGGPRVMTLAEIVRYARDVLGLKRAIVPLPDALGRLQALAMDLVPGKPFSSDNFRSLALDSVPREDGLAALGIAATPVETIVPFMLGDAGHQRRLDRFRSRAARG
ncbi:MAG TPA: complex I NDUFA9 subunit family protein [Xanthomonadales bacterium]|nr:complex I NDUFA9 subunit family protein [Xanthomonadales bacterium]